MDAITMGRDNELVDDIRREQGWSTEKMAELCGYSRTQTNYYCNGQATPPSAFLGQLFEITLDVRIPQLNTGRVPMRMRPRAVHLIGDLSDPGTMKQFVAACREGAEAQAAFLDFIDGGIDPAQPGEFARLQKFIRESEEAAIAQEKLVDAVRGTYIQKQEENARRAKCNRQPVH